MRAGGARPSALGNYLLTGRVLGKGHFARVEEATHSLLHHKVAIKVIDLTCIREEYARRNLHREPRLLARLSHPCVVALYETIMHGPRLYMVMEAAGGGDLSALVLSARGGAARGAAGGLPERRARDLAAQLVSAVRHMHERGVVHRDLKMENIMLDSNKQFIKIVDFGLSNVWTAGGGLRTPCGSLEYAAPELLAPAAPAARRYGPPLDLWSVGVIVYGMVTGALPFTGPAGAGAKGGSTDRPQLRQMIVRGIGRKQRAALTLVSPDCVSFVSRLLETKPEVRMGAEEAARHGWLRAGAAPRRLRAHPLPPLDHHSMQEIYQRLAMLCESDATSVAAQVDSAPYGALGGMYQIEAHRRQMAAVAAAGGADALWHAPGPRRRSDTAIVGTAASLPRGERDTARNSLELRHSLTNTRRSTTTRTTNGSLPTRGSALDGGDGGAPRLPSIAERAAPAPLRLDKTIKLNSSRNVSAPKSTRSSTDGKGPARLGSCPTPGDAKAINNNSNRKSGDGLSSWHPKSVPTTPLRLIQTTTSIKRPSLGNIISPQPSISSHCKSEKATPINWSVNKGMKEPTHLLRLRRSVHPK